MIHFKHLNPSHSVSFLVVKSLGFCSYKRCKNQDEWVRGFQSNKCFFLYTSDDEKQLFSLETSMLEDVRKKKEKDIVKITVAIPKMNISMTATRPFTEEYPIWLILPVNKKELFESMDRRD